MRAGAFFRTLGLWLAVPTAMFGVAYFYALPRLQKEHNQTKAADTETLGTTASSDRANRSYVPPTVKVISRPSREIDSGIRITSSPPRRRRRPKPTVTNAPTSGPPTAPVTKSADPAPPPVSDGGSSPPPETVPVKDGGG